MRRWSHHDNYRAPLAVQCMGYITWICCVSFLCMIINLPGSYRQISKLLDASKPERAVGKEVHAINYLIILLQKLQVTLIKVKAKPLKQDTQAFSPTPIMVLWWYLETRERLKRMYDTLSVFETTRTCHWPTDNCLKYRNTFGGVLDRCMKM